MSATDAIRDPFRFAARQSVQISRFALQLTLPVLAWGVRRTIGHGVGVPEDLLIPGGRDIELPGRGTTFVVDLPGPTPDAPTVLLLHGIFTTGCITWFSVLEDLNRDYRVVVFDHRWHGRGIASTEFLVDDCADDAAAVLDALGIDKAIAVGYSMGGATAQVLAQRHPDRVAGLVLCSTAARWGNTKAERGFYTVLDGVNKAMLGGVADRIRAKRDGLEPARTEDTRDVHAWAFAEIRTTSLWALPIVLAELGRFDARAWLPDIDVPVAVVITGRDKAIPTVRQQEMAELLANPTVHEAPGGHASLIFDQPNWKPLFLEAIADVAERSRVLVAG